MTFDTVHVPVCTEVKGHTLVVYGGGGGGGGGGKQYKGSYEHTQTPGFPILLHLHRSSLTRLTSPTMTEGGWKRSSRN